MDINATLQEIRGLIDSNDELDRDRLAYLVEALDEWMSRGGFLPVEWKKKRDVYATYAPCCNIFLKGRHLPGEVHYTLCREKHNGEHLGPAVYLYTI
jgi:hypothetical protein